MKIAFITRSTLFAVPGGDTIQLVQTVKQLKMMGVEADIILTDQTVNYRAYDILHFSNLTRPADILYHCNNTNKPVVLAPLLIDYSEYDRQHRDGIAGMILHQFSPATNEYIKTISRWMVGKDVLRTKSYLWNGHENCVRKILNRADCLLPGSEAEYQRVLDAYGIEKEYQVVPNGIDPELFRPTGCSIKNATLVLCAARFEGVKNQLNLIKALNNTRYTLMLIGKAAPNQQRYYEACRKVAAKNVFFYSHMSQESLIDYYAAATVHALPSWFETCGLSSLEAAAMGCNIAITEKGYTREYFGDDAFYCNPGDVQSIFSAIDQAAHSSRPTFLQQKIVSNYTWQQAAQITLEACKKIISG